MRSMIYSCIYRYESDHVTWCVCAGKSQISLQTAVYTAFAVNQYFLQYSRDLSGEGLDHTAQILKLICTFAVLKDGKPLAHEAIYIVKIVIISQPHIVTNKLMR